MIIATYRLIKVASKVATVAWAAKGGYDLYQKSKKAKKVFDKIKSTKNKVKKLIK